jgi:hypothetical protein
MAKSQTPLHHLPMTLLRQLDKPEHRKQWSPSLLLHVVHKHVQALLLEEELRALPVWLVDRRLLVVAQQEPERFAVEEGHLLLVEHDRFRWQLAILHSLRRQWHAFHLDKMRREWFRSVAHRLLHEHCVVALDRNQHRSFRARLLPRLHETVAAIHHQHHRHLHLHHLWCPILLPCHRLLLHEDEVRHELEVEEAI